MAGHTLPNVYGEMMMQIATDFPGRLVETMRISDMRYWYNGLRQALIKRTAPPKK